MIKANTMINASFIIVIVAFIMMIAAKPLIVAAKFQGFWMC
jgi:hypothetical protein